MGAEYTGRIVPVPCASDGGGSDAIYLMQHTAESCIDAQDDPGIARKINHSRRVANCETRTEQVGTTWRVFIYAIRDIEAEEELTYDYKLADCKHSWATNS